MKRRSIILAGTGLLIAGAPAPATPKRIRGTISSLDGRTLAFCGDDDPDGKRLAPTSLWLMPAAGGQPRNLTATLDRNIQAGPLVIGAALLWTADSSAIVLRFEDRARNHIYRISAADGARTLLAGGERSIESVSMTRDGRLACTISDLTQPAEVHVLEADGSGGADAADVQAARQRALEAAFGITQLTVGRAFQQPDRLRRWSHHGGLTA